MNNKLLEKYYSQADINTNEHFQFYDVYEVSMSSGSSSSSCGACCCCLLILAGIANGF